MTRALEIASSVKLPRLALLVVAIAGLGLAGCDDKGGDPSIQIGANPVLPALQQYFRAFLCKADLRGRCSG